MIIGVLVIALLLSGTGVFVQAEKPENVGLKDLWDAVLDLEEDVDELKEEKDPEPEYEIYMLIDSLQGEATDEDHKDWIEVISYSHEIKGPVIVGGGGGGGAKPVIDDFYVTKPLDRSSPELSLACCKGMGYKKVKIELIEAGGDRDEFMEYELQEVKVTSIVQTGQPDTGEDRPGETLSFSFSKIIWRYSYKDPKTGNTVTSEHYWDVLSNSGG